MNEDEEVSGPSGGGIDGRQAVVFQRASAVLYLARQLFARAGVPFEARDSLPLAAEPYAAAVDLVVEFVTSNYSRSSTAALLRSPHFSFEHAGRPLGPAAIESLARALHETRFAGGRLALAGLAGEWAGKHRDGRGPDSVCADAAPAVAVAAQLAEELRSLEIPGSASALLDILASFLERHGVTEAVADPSPSGRIVPAPRSGWPR